MQMFYKWTGKQTYFPKILEIESVKILTWTLDQILVSVPLISTTKIKILKSCSV